MAAIIIYAKDVIVLANEVLLRCIVSQPKQFENSNNCRSYFEINFFFHEEHILKSAKVKLWTKT